MMLMEKLEKSIFVRLSHELSDWLDLKAQEGYTKAALIRRILDDHRKAEAQKKA